VFTIPLLLQYSIGIPIQANKGTEINKRIQIRKEEVKLFLFSNNTVSHLGLKDSTKKPLDLMSIFGKVIGYKINIKPVVFLYTNYE
jgi:hypothetical protein